MALTPIPALADTERRTEYNPVVASTGPYDVDFHIYGDGTDYENWVEVWHDGVELSPGSQWTLALESGNALATATRPLTDAQVTLVTARSGEIVIRGARRPRRTTQFTEGVGVSARDHNKTYTDIIASAREMFDRMEDTLQLTGTGEAYDANNLPIRGVGTATEDDDAVNLAQVQQILSGGAQADGSYSEGGTGSITMPFTTRMRFWLDMADYCAGDGSDEAAGILKAIDQAVAQNKELIIGRKAFTANSQISKAIGNNRLSMRFERGGRIVFGAGASAGFSFTINGYSAGNFGRVYIECPEIVAAAAHTDSAIKISAASWVAHAEHMVNIESAVIKPQSFGTHKFAKGVHLHKVFNSQIANFHFIGASTYAGAGVYLNECVNVNMHDPDITYADDAIWITTGDDGNASANGPEGFRITAGQLYNVLRGIRAEPQSGASSGGIDIHLDHTHSSVYGAGGLPIKLVKVQQSVLYGLNLYTPGGSGGDELGSIYMSECNAVKVQGCDVIRSAGAAVAGVPAIMVRDLTVNCQIKDNLVSGYDIGLKFNASGDTTNQHGGNNFSSCTTAVSDAGAANLDLGNSVHPTPGTIGRGKTACAVTAYLGAATSNDKTGDGTVYLISGLTELLDTGADFNPTTGIFTAPVTGGYRVDFNILLANLGAGHTRGLVRISTSNRNWDFGGFTPGGSRDATNGYSCTGSTIVDMDAGDTLSVNVAVFSSTKTVGLNGAGNPLTFISISLQY